MIIVVVLVIMVIIIMTNDESNGGAVRHAGKMSRGVSSARRNARFGIPTVGLLHDVYTYIHTHTSTYIYVC